VSLRIKRFLGQFGRLKIIRRPRRVVLLYHAVGRGPDACPEPLFAEQIAWLAEETRVLPLDTLLEGKDPAPLQVAITFDDGYASVAQYAAPILARHGLTGTVYLTAAQIVEKEGQRPASCPELGHLSGEHFMLWSEARTLHAAGWHIGSHGLDHIDMTSLPPAELCRQVQGSRDLIEAEIGAACRAFAYPWGRNNAPVRQAVAKAGYAHAAGAIHGVLGDNTSHFAFPRVDIRRDYILADVRSIVRGNWDYLSEIQARRMRRLMRK
jgi:peptidoglycan/xylan/chitin deacetylase (PgdA/CDA1 family)